VTPEVLELPEILTVLVILEVLVVPCPLFLQEYQYSLAVLLDLPSPEKHPFYT
jgi:hypothetical protein